MQKKLLISLNILFLLILLSVLLLAGLFLYNITFLNQRTASALAQPTPIPSQTALTTAQPVTTADLDIRVKDLERNLDYLQRNLVFQLDEKLFYFGGAALAISAIAAFFGWRTYKDLDDVIQEKIRFSLENELYQLDPASLTIRIPKGHPDAALIASRLRLSGLKKLKEYPELNKFCKTGLTIVPVNTVDEENEFIRFLEQEKPDPEQAAFVLYAPAPAKDFRVSSKTLNRYERVATANMPSTVITAILAISRGLHRQSEVVPPAKPDEQKSG